MASKAEFETVMNHVACGDLVPSIGGVLPLREARQAHLLLEEGRVFGKLVLEP